MCFSSDGQTLLSASADASILACSVESGTPLARIRHTKAVDRLACISPAQFAAADESGSIHIWDTRQQEAACAVQMHRDHVTALVAEPAAHQLLSTSGDGNLGVMDLRTHKVPPDACCSVNHMSLQHTSVICYARPSSRLPYKAVAALRHANILCLSADVLLWACLAAVCMSGQSCMTLHSFCTAASRLRLELPVFTSDPKAVAFQGVWPQGCQVSSCQPSACTLMGNVSGHENMAGCSELSGPGAWPGLMHDLAGSDSDLNKAVE